MSLNIKNEQTHALVRELAALTGVSQTSAVEEAVRRRLDELRSSAGVRPGKFPPEERERRRKAVERIVEQLHRETTQEQRDAMANADDWLYDEMGLPK
ncbi:type II toxin-antitoxin system VapB family antitoxin [Microbacterium aurum]|uniref:Antitoxin n=1 Tax=Microbacterium aurum TaxID=36805 RepID=A0A1P8U4V9_9MICO|nr:type II toxin-antitoxin system VapB family antitoxin [Microbacterium aurum]APZ33142.1 hypothetical protein BOH66_01630 [Microbacterium aurum]MBM7826716.1 antitoxin VapB [Microbacterium aurum]